MGLFQKGLFDIIALALLWGPSFLFMKIAISDITPFSLISLRVGLAGLFLFVVLKLRSISTKISNDLFAHACIVGFFMNGLPFVCFCYSLYYIPTSLSALINGTTPITTILLASLLFKQEALTWNRIMGILCGLGGFAILFLPALLGSSASIDMRGVFLASVGALSYSIGLVYAKKFVQGRSNPLVILMFQLLSSFVLLAMLAMIYEEPHTILDVKSLSVWSSVFALALLGTAFAFMLYYRILIRQGVAMLSMVTYLLPVVASVLGILFLEEEVGMPFALATLLILTGIVMVNRKVRLPEVIEKAEEPA